MLFSIIVGLYTSRVILQVLGVNDFGIYNVVGGIVMMFSFINLGMVASSQRFISYELGRNDKDRLKKVFSTSISIHFCLAFFILLLAETVGLWFLNTKLNIDSERMFAANCVYQCSIFSFMFSIVSVPYNACIVAHEHLKAFSYISIVEIALKLVVVIVLPYINFDRLILYSILVLVVSVIIRLIYGIYCNCYFEECRCKIGKIKDKNLFTDMFSFAGWSFIGNMGFSIKDQGVNILVNMFFGVAVNAARGIAYQVSSVVAGFMANFQMALNPQITKRYASGEIDSMLNLVFRGSKFSFFLLMIIVIPLFIRVPYVLNLWLGDVPEYTVIFLRLALVQSLADSMAGPLIVAMQATGKVRNFQIIISLIMLANLPISYFILKLGAEPYSVMFVAIATSVVGLIARLQLLKALIPFSLCNYMKSVILRCASVCLLAGYISFYISELITDDFTGLLKMCILSLLISFLLISFLGLEKQERKFIVGRFLLILRKNKNIVSGNNNHIK